MTGKILLLLTADNLRAWLWSRGRLSPPQSFVGDAAGFERFSNFLRRNRGPTCLLTDLSGEDFRLETLPRLSGRDRRDLIQRKLEQLYRNTPFRQATLQQRRIDGRQDDAVLFTVLTDPSPVSSWLNVMLAEQTELTGIYSIPTISEPLVADIPSRHLLLVTRNGSGGLRQTYFDDRLLRFSRLTAAHPDHSFGVALPEEIEQTRHYLHSQNLLPADQVLDVRIICHASERSGLESNLTDSASLRYACIDLQELGDRIRPGSAFTDSDATPLFLQLLATRRNPHHYAAPAHTHYARMSRLRRSLHLSSATLAACSLIWSASNVMTGYRMNTDTSAIIANTHQLAQQAGKVRQEYDYPQVTTNDMKTAVELVRKLADSAPEPETILDELSMALSDFPRIQVAKLAWQTAMPAHAEPSRDPETNVSSPEIILVGEVESTGAEDPGAMEYLDGFRQALIAHGYNVTASDLLPHGGADNSNDRHRYTLKLSRSTTP